MGEGGAAGEKYQCVEVEINARWLRQNLSVPPKEEEEDINEGSRVMPDIDLCRDRIYRPISEESVVTMENIYEVYKNVGPPLRSYYGSNYWANSS